MKQNTQKLLTWLYTPPQARPFLATSGEIKFLLPAMTAGGRRSLIHYLTQKHWLRTERIQGQTYLSLTSHGRDALLAQFPALNPVWEEWNGVWSILIFMTAPSGDPHFRYLRQLLLDHHAFSFSRGAYLYPGFFPASVQAVCKQMYVGAVTIMNVKEWTFGDERSLVNAQYSLTDLAAVYSGISSEINRLLDIRNNQKGLTSTTQSKIFSVFDRFFHILGQDPGLVPHYYPQTKSAAEILSQLQALKRPIS